MNRLYSLKTNRNAIYASICLSKRGFANATKRTKVFSELVIIIDDHNKYNKNEER